MSDKSDKTIIVNAARLGGTVNKRSLEQVARQRHRRGKSTSNHLADKLSAPKPAVNDLKKPMTEEGLSIEAQVQKKWDPKKGGLPIFYSPPPGRVPRA